MIGVTLSAVLSLTALPLSDPIVNEVSFGAGTWVEIYNPTGGSLDLTGWKLLNARGSDEIPSFTIRPYGYVVVAASQSAFQSAFPGVSDVVYLPDGTIGSGLSGSADMLALVSPGGSDIDLVNWGTPDVSWPNYRAALWPSGVVLGSGGTIARIPNGLDRDLPNDFRDTPSATPADGNSYPTNLNNVSWGKIKALFSGSHFR